MLLYEKMLSPCVVCSYPAEINCAHDCSLELRPAGICRPCPCYWTASKEGGHIQPAFWGQSPALLVTETQPSLSTCVWPHHSDPQLIPPGWGAFPAWRAHGASSTCLMDRSARLCIFSIPYLYLVLPYLFPSLWGSTNRYIFFFNTMSAVKGMCCLTSFLRWFEIRSLPEKRVVILKYFFLAYLP